jgi:N-acetylneuraminic acid mutarotase
MSSRIQRRVAVVAAAMIISILTAVAAGPGRWVKLAPIPQRCEELYAVTANGKIYIMGECPENEGEAAGPPRVPVYEYNPANDQWTKKKPMAVAARHIAPVEYRGKIFVFGGEKWREGGAGTSQLLTENAWEYDPAADTWKALAPMPTIRLAAVAVESGGKIYVIGGAGHHAGSKDPSAPITATTPHRALDINEAYDPATNTWQKRSPMPTARNHAFAGAVNGKIYVIGGQLSSSFTATASNTDVVEEYDPATDSWGVPKTRMPTSRSGGGFGVYHGRIYVGGGQTYDAHLLSAHRALEVYDPATNQWAILPSMPSPRHGVTGAIVGNRFHLIGGHMAAANTGGHIFDTDAHDAFEIAEP